MAPGFIRATVAPAALLWALVGGPCGCGDALPPADYAGEVLYSHPDFTLGGESEVSYTRPVWALFWVQGGKDAPDSNTVREAEGSGRPFTVSGGPLYVFHRPTNADLATTAGGGRYAIGRLMIYDDANDDGRRGSAEALLGYADTGLLFAPTDLTPAASPTGAALAAGYHPVDLPLPCAPVRAGDAACDVPLGASCDADADCGAGECLDENPFWRAGYCALPFTEAGCAPADGVRYMVGEGENDGAAYWVKACVTDADCAHPAPHYCDVAVGGCLPDHGFELELGEVETDPVCADAADRDNDGPGDGPPPPPPPPPPPRD